MAFLQALSAYLPPLSLRSVSEIEQEIVDELEFHIAMLTEENMSRGMTAAAARAAAVTQFGDFAAVQQQCRRALLGTRIMWQRIQILLSAVSLAAVVFLAFQLFSSQRANQAAIEKITASLQRTAGPAAATQGPVEQGLITKGEVAQSAGAPAAATDSSKPYAIELNADNVREFPALTVAFGKLKLQGQGITVVPISTAAGVTGAVLIGSGSYSYMPAAGQEFAGHFRAGMLRFNPQDAEAIIKLADGKAVADKGAVELARAVLKSTFGHCYHAGQQALIPSQGAIAADLFSQELGEVLMSGDDKVDIVFDFTARNQLYSAKQP